MFRGDRSTGPLPPYIAQPLPNDFVATAGTDESVFATSRTLSPHPNINQSPSPKTTGFVPFSKRATAVPNTSIDPPPIIRYA